MLACKFRWNFISGLTWPPCHPSTPLMGNIPARWISFLGAPLTVASEPPTKVTSWQMRRSTTQGTTVSAGLISKWSDLPRRRFAELLWKDLLLTRISRSYDHSGGGMPCALMARTALATSGGQHVADNDAHILSSHLPVAQVCSLLHDTFSF